MKLKTFLSTILFAIFYLIFAMPVKADTICQPIYGGGESCVQRNIVITKKIQDSTGNFVEVNNLKFPTNQPITFQLTLTNTGTTPVNSVSVKDILPPMVTFNSGPGNFDPATRTINFQTTNLNPGESRNFTITVNPTQTTKCDINQAIATTDTGLTSQDNLQFCLEQPVSQVTTKGGLPAQPTTKGGLPVFPSQPTKQTPPTGPEMLSLIGLIPAGIAGQYLRRKSVKK